MVRCNLGIVYKHRQTKILLNMGGFWQCLMLLYQDIVGFGGTMSGWVSGSSRCGHIDTRLLVNARPNHPPSAYTFWRNC